MGGQSQKHIQSRTMQAERMSFEVTPFSIDDLGKHHMSRKGKGNM